MSVQPRDDFDAELRGATSDGAAGAPVQPADSAIKIDRFPDGVTIEVPAAGLWKGSSGLFAFAVLWNGILGLISLCLVGALFDVKQQQGQDAVWILPLILSFFWLIGIVLMLVAVNMGQRRAALAMMGGSLMVIQTGLFGSRQREWPADDLDDVRVGPSGMTVNDQPVLQLQIIDGGGNKFGLLTGRREDELHWLAAELRAALRRGMDK